MTRETAKIKVELLDDYLSHTCQDYGERDHEAMMMAIKALEQEPILDKIKVEIDRQEEWLIDAGYNLYNVHIALNAIKLVVNKYKAESEKT